MLTRLPGLNLFPRPYERGYSGACIFEGAVNPASDGEALIQAGRYAWFGVYPTPDEVKVLPSTEPKAVLEHRAPKTSTPILHSRSAESKVGRAVHCAPVVSCRHGFSAGTLPSAPLRARLRLTAETLRRRESVGRAVHCAPVWVVLTRLRRLESCCPRSYGRGYGARPSGAQ